MPTRRIDAVVVVKWAFGNWAVETFGRPVIFRKARSEHLSDMTARQSGTRFVVATAFAGTDLSRLHLQLPDAPGKQPDEAGRRPDRRRYAAAGNRSTMRVPEQAFCSTDPSSWLVKMRTMRKPSDLFCPPSAPAGKPMPSSSTASS